MPSETIENSWDFTFYMFFGIIIIIVFLPVIQNLYIKCLTDNCKILVKTIKSIGEQLEENMTTRLSIAKNFQEKIFLMTSKTRIILYMEGGIEIGCNSKSVFYDSTLELKDQILISKVRGRILVRNYE